MTTEAVSNENVKIMGRHVFWKEACWLAFSAGFIEFDFTGSRIRARVLSDYEGEERLIGVLGVFVDGSFEKKIFLDSKDKEYDVVSWNEEESHRIQLMRFDEAPFGKVGIRSIIHDGKIMKTEKLSKKIEYVGDSITCAYGVEAKNELEPFCTQTENPSLGYAVLTAKELGADYELVSWSGNGIISQWIPPEVEEPLVSCPLMPYIYEKTDFAGALLRGEKTPEDFDFTTDQPDAVVINLGTNDASYTRRKPEREQVFESEYTKFLKTVREKRPTQKIFVTYGVLEDSLVPTIERIVGSLCESDKNLFFVKYEIHEGCLTKGADYHPSIETQKKMSERLVAKMKECGF